MSMKKIAFSIEGIGRLLFGKPVHETKRDDEKPEQLERRTWKQKAHVDSEGRLFLPAESIKRSLVWSAKWLSMKFQGQKTYTKRFESGIMCHKPEFLLYNGKGQLTLKEDITELPLFVPSDGKRGGTKRVWRSFPIANPGWKLDGELILTDESISKEVFEKHLKTSGVHDGLGSMRIGNMGPNGSFVVNSIEFNDYDL